MSNRHLLIDLAVRKPYHANPTIPEGASYDPLRGYWIKDGTALIDTPGYGVGPVTKKCDQETGEDQKGE